VLGQLGPRGRAVPADHGLLLDQGELVLQGQRVVGADLRAEPVLQRADDPAAVGVVLGVGAGHQDQVHRQPQRVPAHADVPLLQHVEQRHLDPLGQVGQLVEAENAPVGPRHQAVVHGLRVTQGPALGHLHRVDVTDQVADAGVRGGQLLAVAVAGVAPDDRQVLAELFGQPPAPGTHRHVRVVVDLASGHRGRPLVEQPDQGPDQPGLTLAALAEQDHVVTGQQGPLEVREHRVPEADDPGETVLAGPHPGQQVLPDLLFDAPVHVAVRAQFTQRGCGRWPPMPRGGMTMLAVWLHHSTLCPSTGCSHPGRR
jgi:hypothetical protein